jgi:hypothetical protein
MNDQAGAAPPCKLSTSWPCAVTLNWKNWKLLNPGWIVAIVTPFHCTSTNAAASSSGGLNELEWKNPMLYCLPGSVFNGAAGVSVPASASEAVAEPKRATALPECAKGWKKKRVASRVPPAGLVPIQVPSDSAKQKSSQAVKPSKPPSMT